MSKSKAQPNTDELTDPVTEAVDPTIAIQEAFESNYKSGEHDAKMAMVQAGATFKNVGSLYNKFEIDGGYALSKKERTQILDDTLTGLELATDEDFGVAAALIITSLDVDAKSASATVRAWAKKNEVDCYKKPAGTGTPRTGFNQTFFGKLVENPTMTEADVNALIDDKDDTEVTANVVRQRAHYHNMRKLANGIVAKLAA